MVSTSQAARDLQRFKNYISATQTKANFTTAASLACSILLAVIGGYAQWNNSRKRQTNLVYELDAAQEAKYKGIQEALVTLSKCHRLWKVKSTADTWDWKRNAGASHLVDRSDIFVRVETPPRLKTNVQIYSIDLGGSKLYFLPDTILYRDDHGYGSIEYSDFAISDGSTRFIEGGPVPADAKIVQYNWQYSNKDGGPDRRFSNNRQIPVLLLGVLILTSSKGLNVHLYASNEQYSNSFAAAWRRQFRLPMGYENNSKQSGPPPWEKPASIHTKTASEVLGVRDSASATEISAAYYKLAQMYHPDKVASLGPEFRTLAESKMKEINAAYELLKKR